MSKVTVNLIKGPNFKKAEDRAYEHLHHMLLKKGKELGAKKERKDETEAI